MRKEDGAAYKRCFDPSRLVQGRSNYANETSSISDLCLKKKFYPTNNLHSAVLLFKLQCSFAADISEFRKPTNSDLAVKTNLMICKKVD